MLKSLKQVFGLESWTQEPKFSKKRVLHPTHEVNRYFGCWAEGLIGPSPSSSSLPPMKLKLFSATLNSEIFLIFLLNFIPFWWLGFSEKATVGRSLRSTAYSPWELYSCNCYSIIRELEESTGNCFPICFCCFFAVETSNSKLMYIFCC